MKYFEFPCGCKFPIIGDKDGRPLIQFDPNLENIPLDCERTWDLISNGNTKGCFQLESRLGQVNAKALKPRNIEHLSALVAIIRPGSLESKRDDGDGPKTVTQHYIDRKNGLEAVTYFHPALEKILGKTYGEMIYQEQAMEIARVVAGFDLQQADVLRKAIGKKKPEIMAAVKKEFLAGAKKVGIVTTEQAEEIFGWIEKSQRYSFNKSHSVSYAINAYLCAYAKAHFSRVFFTSYLYHSDQKTKPQEEVRELINNAKSMAIYVMPPDLRHVSPCFKMVNGQITFGIQNIKGLGTNVVDKIINTIKEIDKPIKEWDWIDFLVKFCTRSTSTAIKGLIASGAVSYFGIPRTKMLFEYEIYSQVSKTEHKKIEQWIDSGQNRPSNLLQLLQVCVAVPPGRKGLCATKTRVDKLKGLIESMNNPPYNLEDSPEWISSIEEYLLGISLTCSHIDSCNINAANCNCQEFTQGYEGKNGIILIGAQIDDVVVKKTKNGKNPGQSMAFVTISDSTGIVDAVAFPDTWGAYKDLLTCRNTCLFSGTIGKEKGTLILKKIWQV